MLTVHIDKLPDAAGMMAMITSFARQHHMVPLLVLAILLLLFVCVAYFRGVRC